MSPRRSRRSRSRPRPRVRMSTRTRFIVTVVAVVVLAVVGLGTRGLDLFRGEDGSADGSGAAASRAASPLPAGLTAQQALDSLETKGKAARTGYSRDAFGARWADVDHNGCDTRNDILARDLTQITLRPGTCKVATGVLKDPYTGRRIDFTAGAQTSAAVQIDHVVALSDAWQTGAQQLSTADRMALANDPLNLLAVDGPANNGKSDGDAATWLPEQKSFRCEYVARQAGVKRKYDLWVTRAERAAMQRVLDTCPGQRIPTR